MLPVIQAAAAFFPDHGTACPKVGLGMVCVFLELKVLLSSGLASQRVHGQVPWLGAVWEGQSASLGLLKGHSHWPLSYTGSVISKVCENKAINKMK